MVYIDMMKNTNNMEEWRPIPGYEGSYEVSNTGLVRSVDKIVKSRWGCMRTIKGHIKKQCLARNGYLCVSLYDRDKFSYSTVHRLVAMVFIPNPNNLPVVNHIDGNKLNNNASNLEWCSYQYNTIHAYDNNLITTRAKKVRCIETGMEFGSLMEASLYLGFNKGAVSNAMKKGKTCKGYHFEYIK